MYPSDTFLRTVYNIVISTHPEIHKANSCLQPPPPSEKTKGNYINIREKQDRIEQCLPLYVRRNCRLLGTVFPLGRSLKSVTTISFYSESSVSVSTVVPKV